MDALKLIWALLGPAQQKFLYSVGVVLAVYSLVLVGIGFLFGWLLT